MIKVGVIYGGESVEHEVSIITAVTLMENLDTEKYEAIPIYISKEREWYTGDVLKKIENYQDLDNLKRYAKKMIFYRDKNKFIIRKKDFPRYCLNEVDIIIPAVHGANVEDGSIQGYLEILGVPYVGSNVYGSVLGQDKVFMKQIFKDYMLPITKYIWFFDTEYNHDSKKIIKEVEHIGYPVIVKPATLGSSVGISKAKNEEELLIAIDEALQYDYKIVVEECIEDMVDINCSVLGDYQYQQTSEIQEIKPKGDYFTYEEKYISGNKKGKMKNKKGVKGSSNIYIMAPNISNDIKKEIREISKKAFIALNLSGLARMDFIVNKKENKVYINEPNTIPGDFSYFMWEAVGKEYKNLLDDLITLAIKQHRKKGKRIFSFETNLLQNPWISTKGKEKR